jgi:hypothetical protein
LALSVAGAMVVIAGIAPGKPNTQAAQVKSDFGAVARYVFIPSRNAPIVTVIETIFHPGAVPIKSPLRP